MATSQQTEPQSPQPQLISVSPANTLVFQLAPQVTGPPKQIVKVTNISKQKVAFKVKTTQPSWYYVRPNQQIVDVGQTEEVAIVLAEQAASKDPSLEKLDKHRFLVQSKAISDEHFENIKNMKPTERALEYTKIWDDSQKDDRKNIKLKVEFQYADKDTAVQKDAAYQSAASTPVRNSNGAETVRGVLARPPGTDEHLSGNSADSGKELEALKKKYDAVVEYTVHLTAERDTILAQLEVAQRQLASNSTNNKRATDPARPVKTKDGEQKTQGYPFYFLILAAVLFFFVGKHYSISSK